MSDGKNSKSSISTGLKFTKSNINTYIYGTFLFESWYTKGMQMYLVDFGKVANGFLSKKLHQHLERKAKNMNEIFVYLHYCSTHDHLDKS